MFCLKKRILISKMNLKSTIFYNYLFLLFMLLISVSSIAQNKEDYTRYLDSAEYYFDEKPKLSLSFLDSIPQPLENSIKGEVDEFFWIKAVAFDRLNELTLSHQNFLLALRQAELEEDYQMAGDISLELFYYQYPISNNQEAFDYLEKAKFYYEKIDDEYGLLEAKQALAYVKFLDKRWQESNGINLEHLNSYKNFDDKFLYFSALYMLASSNAHLDNIEIAKTYFSELETLKGAEGVDNSNFLFYKGVVNLDIANYYYRKKNIDSALVYLSRTDKSRKVMSHSVTIDYFSLHINIFKELSNINLQQAYIDSLYIFEKEIYSANIESSFQVNESLLQTETNLEETNNKRLLNLVGVILLFLGILVLVYILYKNKKKAAIKLVGFKENLSKLTYLNYNHQKLATKVTALEDHIKELKADIKSISNVSDIKEQRKLILNLYKKTHLKSTDVLNLGESHLKLINELNVDFFNEISSKHPELNESEFILCYYLFMGFKNKEIAFFLNTTVRSIESKRYRLSKKISGINKNKTLQEYLNETFKNSQNFSPQ